MRTIKIFTCLCVLFSPPLFATDFCVQTFNAYGPLYAPNLKLRTQNLIHFVQHDNCDIWQMQEVWKASHFHALTTGFLNYNNFFYDGIRNDGKQTGLANFIKANIISTTSQIFSTNDDGNIDDQIRKRLGIQKGFSITEISIDNIPVLLVNTHLHNKSTKVRKIQLHELVDYVNAHFAKDMPLILTGDFNSTPDSIELETIQAALGLENSYLAVHKNYDNACTYCQSNSLSHDHEDRVIDYILYRSSANVHLTVKDAFINLNDNIRPEYSDHYGMRAIFSLEPNY